MTELDRIEKDLNSIDKTLGRIANALEALTSMQDSFQDDLVELVKKESEESVISRTVDYNGQLCTILDRSKFDFQLVLPDGSTEWVRQDKCKLIPESELGIAIGETPIKSSHGFYVGDRVIYKDKPYTILNFDKSGELCTLHSKPDFPNHDYNIGYVAVCVLEKDER